MEGFDGKRWLRARCSPLPASAPFYWTVGLYLFPSLAPEYDCWIHLWYRILALIPLDGAYERENQKLGSLGALPRGWKSLSFNAFMLICASSAFTSCILILSRAFTMSPERTRSIWQQTFPRFDPLLKKDQRVGYGEYDRMTFRLKKENLKLIIYKNIKERNEKGISSKAFFSIFYEGRLNTFSLSMKLEASTSTTRREA